MEWLDRLVGQSDSMKWMECNEATQIYFPVYSLSLFAFSLPLYSTPVYSTPIYFHRRPFTEVSDRRIHLRHSTDKHSRLSTAQQVLFRALAFSFVHQPISLSLSLSKQNTTLEHALPLCNRVRHCKAANSSTISQINSVYEIDTFQCHKQGTLPLSAPLIH